MNFSTLFRIKENLNLDKNTLTILRYIAIFGQFLAINIVFFFLGLPFPIELSYAIIFIGLLTNIYLQFGIKINQLKDLYASISALIKFITKAFITEDGQIKRTINQKGESINGFLDDYSFTKKIITSSLGL